MKDKYRVLGYVPDDSRLRIDRHTDKFYPITRFISRQDVEKRRDELQFNLRMAAGLYPWPEKTPLNVQTEDYGDFDGFSIKKIKFETYPGIWSTGNLYLPSPLKANSPAILNLLGHFQDQRLTRDNRADFPQQLANFAKMGFICLITDMIGMIDNTQISHGYGHEEKELWLSNGLGVQLWNNIRALDVLCEMPQVDKNNIGVTGCSGGGSQTLFLSLIDDRVKAAAPINMISLHMQGGCRCENAAGLRINTDNTEMCAMIAPRPLFLAGSTGDWTKYLKTAELPGVLEAYRQYDAENMVEHFYQDAEHQYNAKTRHHVYNFFARHLMGQNLKWTEQTVDVGDVWSMTWLPKEKNINWQEIDDRFYDFHKKERKEKIAGTDIEQKKKMLRWMTGIKEKQFNVIKIFSDEKMEKGFIFGENGEKLPYVKLIPENWDGNRVCLMLGENGKDILESDEAQKIFSDGYLVMSADLFMTGEFEGCNRLNESHGYFTTFNYTTDAYRTQDAAVMIAVAKTVGEDVTVYATGNAACAAGCAIAISEDVKAVKLDGNALNIRKEEYLSKFHVPGICLLGGLNEIIKLSKCNIKII